jgi:hypothetical protein
MFKIGERVMCVDASFNAETRPYMPCWIKLHGIYHIRGIHKDPSLDGYGVYLEEVINPEQVWANDEPREWSFSASRFRPTLLKRAEMVSALSSHERGIK